MGNPWRVEGVTEREQLQALLNTLDADGYYITFVLTHPESFTVVAKARRLSGYSEAKPPIERRESDPGLTMTLDSAPAAAAAPTRKKKRAKVDAE